MVLNFKFENNLGFAPPPPPPFMVLDCVCVCRCVCVCVYYCSTFDNSRGGRGIVEDMCYERRRAEAGRTRLPITH